MQQVVRLIVLAALICAASTNVHGGLLIAHESFSEYTGTVTGQNGGVGWSGAWRDNTAISVDSGSITTPGLSYPGLTSAGDKATLAPTAVKIHQNDRAIDTASLPRSLTVDLAPTAAGFALGADDTTVWVSFLARNDNGGSREFRASIGNAVVEQVDGASTWSLRGAGDTGKSTAETSLLLLRFDYAAGQGTDLVRLWVNPSELSAAPDGPADASLLGDWNFNRISFLSSLSNVTYSATVASFDEIRIGTEFADVVPEPAALASLTAFLSLGFASRTFRRR